MAACQLEVQTPHGSSGMTICLSDRTRVIAHAGLKYKSGYITISRYSEDKDRWRNSHIARKSIEKLLPESGKLLESLKKKELHQIPLTKKQFLMTTKFQKAGRETLHFISLLHTKADHECVTDDAEFNHAKTINLRLEEYEKLHSSLPRLYEVIKTVTSPSDENRGCVDAEEPRTIAGHRWAMKNSGRRSNSIFLTYAACQRNATAYVKDLPENLIQNADDVEFVISTVQVPRPTKLEVMEQVAYNEVLRKTGYSEAELSLQPPPAEEVAAIIDNLDKSEIVQITARVSALIGHNRLYFLNDIYDVFVYVGGLEKVQNAISKHHTSPSNKLFARLVDSCYNEIVRGEQPSQADFNVKVDEGQCEFQESQTL